MSAQEFLDKSAFDGIISSLEALLTEVQGLVDSLDPLNDTQVIADFQDLADSLAELLSVAGNLPEINSVEENLTAINAVNDALANVNIAATNIANINTVAGNDTNITILAGLDTEISGLGGIITEIQTTAANIQAIIDAPGFAQAAEDARDKAEQWADEDEDVPVETTPDRFSSKHWAIKSDDSAQISLGVANFAGRWEDLTGALNVPSTVFHEDQLWLLLDDLADVTTSEPGEGNTDWRLLNLTQITQSIQASVDEYPFAGWTVGGSESSIDISHEGEILVYRNGSLLDENSWGLAGTVLTINFELTTDDIVTVLKLSEVVGLSQINDQDEETDPESTDNLVAQKTDGSIVRVAWGAIKTWLQSNFSIGDHSDVDTSDHINGNLLVRDNAIYKSKSPNIIIPVGWVDHGRFDVMDNFDRPSLGNAPTGQTWQTFNKKGGTPDTITLANQMVFSSGSVGNENMLILLPVARYGSYVNKYSRLLTGKIAIGSTKATATGLVFAKDENNYIEVVQQWTNNYGVDIIIDNIRTSGVETIGGLIRYYVAKLSLSLIRQSQDSVLRLGVLDTTNGISTRFNLDSYFSDFDEINYVGAHLRWDKRSGLYYISSESLESKLAPGSTFTYP